MEVNFDIDAEDEDLVEEQQMPAPFTGTLPGLNGNDAKMVQKTISDPDILRGLEKTLKDIEKATGEKEFSVSDLTSNRNGSLYMQLDDRNGNFLGTIDGDNRHMDFHESQSRFRTASVKQPLNRKRKTRMWETTMNNTKQEEKSVTWAEGLDQEQINLIRKQEAERKAREEAKKNEQTAAKTAQSRYSAQKRGSADIKPEYSEILKDTVHQKQEYDIKEKNNVPNVSKTQAQNRHRNTAKNKGYDLKEKHPVLSDESKSELEKTVTDDKVRANVENAITQAAQSNKTLGLTATDIQYDAETREARVMLEDKDGKDLGTVIGNEKSAELKTPEAMKETAREAREAIPTEQDIANSTLDSFRESMNQEISNAMKSIDSLESAIAMPDMAEAFNKIRENIQSIGNQGIDEMAQAVGAKVDAVKDAVGQFADGLENVDKQIQTGFQELADNSKETVKTVGDKFKDAMDKAVGKDEKTVEVRDSSEKTVDTKMAIAGAIEAINVSKMVMLKHYEKENVRRAGLTEKLVAKRDKLINRREKVEAKWEQIGTLLTGREGAKPKLFTTVMNARISKVEKQMSENQQELYQNAEKANELETQVSKSLETFRTMNQERGVKTPSKVDELLKSAENRAKTANIMRDKSTKDLSKVFDEPVK